VYTSWYFRKEAGSRKEPVINIDTGSFSDDGELWKHQKQGSGVNINVKSTQ
jgi:hypothetical protein